MATARLDGARLVPQAIEVAGLEDFGEPTWREGLDRLVAALDHEGRLNDLGGGIVTSEILGYLTNRPRLVDWRDPHPAIATGAGTAPPRIGGQPRAGTTIPSA